MGYAFLIIAAASLGLLGVMHKVADHRKCRPNAINLFLFLGAGSTMSAFTISRMGLVNAFHLPAAAWVTAVACGALASVAILSFQHGVRFGKISTSWLVINLSTALPTLLSIAIYHEFVSVRRALGLVLAMAALGILWLERRREEQSKPLAVSASIAAGEQ